MKKLFASVLAVAMVFGMPGKMSRAEGKDKSTAQVEQTVVTETPKTEETITKTALSSKDEGLIKKVWNAIKNNIKSTSWKTTILFLSLSLIASLVSPYVENYCSSKLENALLKKEGCAASANWKCFSEALHEESFFKDLRRIFFDYRSFFSVSANVYVWKMLIKCLI